MTLIDYSGLTRPGTYRCPMDVLRDPHLPQARKRCILADWASDRYAVPSRPWLRRVPGIHEPVALNDILGALAQLDDDPPPRGGAAAPPPSVPEPELTAAHSERTSARNRALITAHQRNIARYYRLLTTPLTDLEKAYVHRRIKEERRELKRLASRRRQLAAPPSSRSRRVASGPAYNHQGVAE